VFVFAAKSENANGKWAWLSCEKKKEDGLRLRDVLIITTKLIKSLNLLFRQTCKKS